MVHLKKVSLDNNIAVYDYMPEHKDAPSGRIGVDIITRQRSLMKLAEGDEYRSYAGHAWRRIDQMLDENNLQDEAYAAWY